MNTSYYDYYHQQAAQNGAGSFFSGPMIQRGYGLGGIFRNLFSFIRPVLKPAAKFLGRTFLKSGSDILSDVAAGSKFKDSFKERMSSAGTHIARKAIQKIGDMQIGTGIKRKRLQTTPHSKRRRLSGRRLDIFNQDGSDAE